MDAYYTDKELHGIGFYKCGRQVLISRKVSIYNPEKMIIGNNVRIDDFCILSGEIVLGSYIHIAAGVYLFGAFGIYIEDFSAISSKSTIYSATDNYDGSCFTSPQFDDKYRCVIGKEIHLYKHAILGSSVVILPGAVIGEGAAVGAMSLVNRDIDPWWIYAGIPARKIRERKQDLLILEKQFIAELELNI